MRIASPDNEYTGILNFPGNINLLPVLGAISLLCRSFSVNSRASGRRRGGLGIGIDAWWTMG